MSSLLTTHTIQNSIWTGIQIILFEFGQVGASREGRELGTRYTIKHEN